MSRSHERPRGGLTVSRTRLAAYLMGLAVTTAATALAAPAAFAASAPFVAPPTPPAFQPGPIGPTATTAAGALTIGPSQQIFSSPSAPGSTSGTVQPYDAVCNLEPDVAASYPPSEMEYSAKVTCAGTTNAGPVEVQICPAKYYNGGWHTFTGDRCKIGNGTDGAYVESTQGCNSGYWYRTWAWDDIPAATPSTAVKDSAAEKCI